MLRFNKIKNQNCKKVWKISVANIKEKKTEQIVYWENSEKIVEIIENKKRTIKIKWIIGRANNIKKIIRVLRKFKKNKKNIIKISK